MKIYYDLETKQSMICNFFAVVILIFCSIIFESIEFILFLIPFFLIIVLNIYEYRKLFICNDNDTILITLRKRVKYKILYEKIQVDIKNVIKYDYSQHKLTVFLKDNMIIIENFYVKDRLLFELFSKRFNG